LKQYEKLTKPVIEFYRGKKVLLDFEGKTSDEIWPKVLHQLEMLDSDLQKSII